MANLAMNVIKKLRSVLFAAIALGSLVAPASAIDCQGQLKPESVRSAGLQVIKDITATSIGRYQSSQDIVDDFILRLEDKLAGQAKPDAMPDFIGHQIRSQAMTCFPELGALVDNHANERNRSPQRDDTEFLNRKEAKRQRQLAEEKARIARLQAEQQRIANLPSNRLLTAYKLYSTLQFCNQVRKGYLVVWINDIELERAHVAVKAIEKKVLAEQSDIDTDAIWKQARSEMKGAWSNQASCQQGLQRLLLMSPVGVYDIQKP
jgi:hypothetical protein